MPTTIERYTADGTTTTYAIPFPFIDQSDVIVRVAGELQVQGQHYEIRNPNTLVDFTEGVTPLGAPPSGDIVFIQRNTSQSTRLVDYQAGSILTESSLDTDSIQGFYMAQEAIDIAQEAITLNSTNQWDLEGRRLVNLGDPIDHGDAVNRGFITTNLPTLESVRDNEENINTVAANEENITTIGTDLNADPSNIRVVFENLPSIRAVQENQATIDQVVANIMHIQAVQANEMNINMAVANEANINTVVGNEANITTVANDLNADPSNITTVATNLADIQAVQANEMNINTVASNIENVNRYADSYFVSATEPESPTLGDLWFDPSDNTMKVYKSTGFDNVTYPNNVTFQTIRTENLLGNSSLNIQTTGEGNTIQIRSGSEMNIGTQDNDLEISTVSGKLALLSNSGNVELDSTSGSVILNSLGGTANFGSNVNIASRGRIDLVTQTRTRERGNLSLSSAFEILFSSEQSSSWVSRNGGIRINRQNFRS